MKIKIPRAEKETNWRGETHNVPYQVLFIPETKADLAKLLEMCSLKIFERYVKHWTLQKTKQFPMAMYLEVKSFIEPQVPLGHYLTVTEAKEKIKKAKK